MAGRFSLSESERAPGGGRRLRAARRLRRARGRGAGVAQPDRVREAALRLATEGVPTRWTAIAT